MKIKRMLAMLGILASTTMVFTGCGSSDEPSGGEGDGPVTLTWYYPDDVGPHTDAMWAELNKYLEEKINVVIDYKIVSWGEYGTKTNTVKSSGQDFDIMFESGSYQNTVNQGAAYPITDLLDTAGADMKDAIPESIWAAATIDGDIYGVPTYKDSALVWGIIYNKTMAEEAGIEIPEEIDLSYKTLADFMIDANEKIDATYGPDNGILISNAWATIDAWEDFGGRTVVANITKDPAFANREAGEVFSPFTEPEMLDYYKTVRQLVEDDIYPLDGPNVQIDPYKQDGKFFMELSMGYVSFPEHGWSEDYETAFIPVKDTYMTTIGATFGTNIVGANSKNAEKAVEFLNLLNTDNYVANTIRFGIEGDYYNKTDDNRLDFTGTLNEDPSARAYYRWYGWQFGNIFAMSLPAQEDDQLFVKLMEANEKAHPGDHIGFVFDTTPVSNEMAAISAVRTEYENNLVFGMIDDVEGSLKAFTDKLYEVGLQKVIDEAQKQVNEWRKANGLSVFGE